MSYSLNSLKGFIEGIIYGTAIGVFKGHTRSLDSSSYKNPKSGYGRTLGSELVSRLSVLVSVVLASSAGIFP